MAPTLRVLEGGYDADRLKLLQSVYNWYAPFMVDRRSLALALLKVPEKFATFDQVRQDAAVQLGLIETARAAPRQDIAA